MYRKLREDRVCNSGDMLAGRQTDRHGRPDTPLHYRWWGGVMILSLSFSRPSLDYEHTVTTLTRHNTTRQVTRSFTAATGVVDLLSLDNLSSLHSAPTELNWNDLQQVDPVTRRIHWSRASASRLYFVLIGCSETGTVSAQLVLNTCIPMRPFTPEFSSAQFSSYAVNL